MWKRIVRHLTQLGIVALVVWAAIGAEVSIPNIVGGFPNIISYLGKMIPPSGAVLSKIWIPLVETFQIAIIAIVLASIMAFPCSLLAARNVMPYRIIYQTSRTVLGILRGIPPLLYALLFVSMVGLGPFAGVLALTFHCVGALGRFFAEAIENINPEVIDAAKATGANRPKVVIYAIVPELKILLLGYILYYFEYNFRTCTILGLVGAGGIGLLLVTSIHLFKYAEIATIMLAIIIIIALMDRISAAIRGRLV